MSRVENRLTGSRLKGQLGGLPGWLGAHMGQDNGRAVIFGMCSEVRARSVCSHMWEKQKDNFKALRLSSWKDGVSIHCGGDVCRKHGIGSYQTHSIVLARIKILSNMSRWRYQQLTGAKSADKLRPPSLYSIYVALVLKAMRVNEIAQKIGKDRKNASPEIWMA